MIAWGDAGGWPRRVPVEDGAAVVGARQLAVAAAREIGLSAREVDAVDLAVCELAENLHRHAVGGQIIVTRPAARPDRPELAVLAVDQGPGVARFDRCLADGYSTNGTLGTGLGAVVRRARHFDACSEVGRGTVVHAVFGSADDPARRRFDVGAMGFPLAGEAENGDAYLAVQQDTRLTVMVADGLGHGPDAARASRAAIAEFAGATGLGPAAALARVNERIVASRGAAATIASALVTDFLDGGEIGSAGLGNVAVLTGNPSGTTKRIMVEHGTVGVRARSSTSERRTPAPAGTTLVLHTDGLSSQWTLDGRAELLRHDAQTIATVLWRDFVRDTDDSLVVVARALPWSAP